MKDIFDLISRLFLSAIFLFESYSSVKHISRSKATMLHYGFHWNPELLLYTASFLLLVGGIFLLIGFRPGFAVTLLLIYWIPVTFMVYQFWDAPEGTKNIQTVNFLKNIAIIGGLIHILIHGVGKYSIRRFFGMMKLPKEKW